jgi:butyrate kinase
VLTINPGSTSTKVALFRGEEEIFTLNLSHPVEELAKFEKMIDQYDYRKSFIIKALEDNSIDVKCIDAVVGRGGLLHPIPGGTYEVNESMLNDLREAKRGEHASNLGGMLAYWIAKDVGCPSYIVDPVVVDEMNELARISGTPLFPRISIFHALNQKAVARQAAAKLGHRYEEVNLIVVHMGGGVSVGVHEKGRVVDVNNALDGDGPFSPERAGGVPAGALVKHCFSGKYTETEIKKQLKGAGGLVAYLGTTDMREVEKRVEAGDEQAKLIYRAMAYQIAKEIGQMATVVNGRVDAIVMTGGIAHSKAFMSLIEERVSFIAKIMVIAGEKELESLRDGALRILKGEESPHIYT